MTRLQFLIRVISLQLYCSLAFSGGPLDIEGATGNTPVSYQSANITLNVESGPLGSTSNAVADGLLMNAFTLWNDVTTSDLNLTLDEAAMAIDINGSNFTDVLPNPFGGETNDSDLLNPVVYDADGAIIDAFFGVGQSDNTLGFAGSFLNTGSNFYTEGFAVINGRDIGLTTTEFTLTITHEIGHFFGLDHSQININSNEQFFGSPGLCQTTSLDNYPAMYPFVCRNVTTLHLDDTVAVSALYPDASFNTDFGILSGLLTNLSGRAIIGANVFAVNTTTNEVVSIVSDYLKQRTGFYKLYLPAGNYTLHVNSINSLFNGGSSVGPYANNILDESFQIPHPLTEATYQENDVDAIIAISTNNTTNINFELDVEVGGAEDADEEEVEVNKSSTDKILGAISGLPILLFLMISLMRRNQHPA